MAKSSKAIRGSVAKPRSSKRPKPPPKKAAVAKKASVRSAAPAKRAVAAKTKASPSKPTPAVKPAASSPLFQKLSLAEQRAVRQALSGEATLLESSPRARDAALFCAVASLASRPVLVASPLAAELFGQASAISGVEVVAFGSFAPPGSALAGKKRLARGGALLVVVEPAQLFDSALRQALAKTPLALVGIAAAHACSEHAHELSPAYLSLREALRALVAPVLATCTSTSARVVEQITEAIGGSAGSVVAAERAELTRAAQVVRSGERKAALF